ncbi:polyprotein [Striga-associated poty-like virus 2]|nr:polyprotein [Striga potyvirus B]QXU65888.1 polyprotein [Striga-associated poty-like virus 2]
MAAKIATSYVETGLLFGSWTPQNVWAIDGPTTEVPQLPTAAPVRNQAERLVRALPKVQEALEEGAKEVVLSNFQWGSLSARFYNPKGVGHDILEKKMVLVKSTHRKPLLEEVVQTRFVTTEKQILVRPGANICAKTKRPLRPGEVKQLIKATGDPQHPLFCLPITKLIETTHPIYRIEIDAKEEFYVLRGDVRLLSRRQRQKLHQKRWNKELVIDESDTSSWNSREHWVEKLVPKKAYTKYIKCGKLPEELEPWTNARNSDDFELPSKNKLKKMSTAQKLACVDKNFEHDLKGHCWRNIFTDRISFGDMKSQPKGWHEHRFGRVKGSFIPLVKFCELLQEEVARFPSLAEMLVPRPFCYREGGRLVYHVGYSKFSRGFCSLQSLLHPPIKSGNPKVPKSVLLEAVVGAEPTEDVETFDTIDWEFDLGVPIVDIDLASKVAGTLEVAEQIADYQTGTTYGEPNDVTACELGHCYHKFWWDPSLPVWKNDVNRGICIAMTRSFRENKMYLRDFLVQLEDQESMGFIPQVKVVATPFIYCLKGRLYMHVGDHPEGANCGRNDALRYIHEFSRRLPYHLWKEVIVGASPIKKKKWFQVTNSGEELSGEELVTVNRKELLKLLRHQQKLSSVASGLVGENCVRPSGSESSSELFEMLNSELSRSAMNCGNASSLLKRTELNGNKQHGKSLKFWESKWMPILGPLLGVSSLEILHQMQMREGGSWLDLGISNKLFQMTSTVAIRSMQTYFTAKMIKGIWNLSKSEVHMHVMKQVHSLHESAGAETLRVKAWYANLPASVKILFIGAIFMGSVHFVRKLFRVKVVNTDGNRADGNFSEVVRVSVSQRQALPHTQPSKQVKLFMTAAGMIATVSMFCDVRTARYIKEWMDLWWYAVTSATQMGSFTDLIMSPREYLKSIMDPQLGEQHAFNQRFLTLIRDAEQQQNGIENNSELTKTYMKNREALGMENPMSEVQGFLLHEILDQVQEAPFTYMGALKGLNEILVSHGTMYQIAKDLAEGFLKEKFNLLNAPTGSGKSTIFPAYVSARTKKRILILVPLVAATMGIYSRLNEKLPNQVGYHADKTSANVHAKIIVSTYGHIAHQLMQGMDPYENYGIILADECHVSTLETAVVITDLLARKRNMQQSVMFMTATPFKHLTLESVATEQDVQQVRTSKFQSVKTFINYCREGGEQRVLQTAENGCIIFCATHKEVVELASFLNSPSHPAIAYHSGLRSPLGEFIEKNKDRLGKFPYFVCATNALESGVTIPARTCIDFSTKIVSQVEGDRNTVSMARQTITMPEQIQRRGRIARTQPGIYLYTHAGEQNQVRLDPDSSVKYLLNCWVNRTVCCKEICDLPDESTVRITRAMVPMVWCHDTPPLVQCSLMDHLGCIFQNAIEFCGAFQSVPGQMPATTTMLDSTQVAKFHVMTVTLTNSDEVQDLKVPQPHHWFNEPRVVALWNNLLKSSSFELTPGECSERKNNMLARLESQVAYNSTSTDLDLASLLAKFYENIKVFRQQISAMQSFTANTLEKTAFLDSFSLLSFANKNIRLRSEKRIKEIEQDIADTEACILFLEARLTGQCDANLAIEKTEQDKIKEYLACLMDMGYAKGSFQSCFFIRETTWRRFRDFVDLLPDGTYRQKSFTKRILETARSHPWIGLSVCSAGVAICCYALFSTLKKSEDKGMKSIGNLETKSNVFHAHEVVYLPESMPYAGTLVKGIAISGASFLITRKISDLITDLRNWWTGKSKPKIIVKMDDDQRIDTVWYDIYEGDTWIASFETLSRIQDYDSQMMVCSEFRCALDEYKSRFLQKAITQGYVPEGKGKLRAHRTKALKKKTSEDQEPRGRMKAYYDPYSEGKTRRGLKKVFRQFYNVDDADVKEIIIHGEKHEPVLVISSLDALNAEVDRVKYSDPHLYALYQDVKEKLENAEDDDPEAYLQRIKETSEKIKGNARWVDFAEDEMTDMIYALQNLVKKASEEAFIPVTVKTYDGRTIQATVANYRGKWQETSWPRIDNSELRQKLDDALRMLPEGFVSKIKDDCTDEQAHEIDELVKCVLHENARKQNREAVMPGTQCQTDVCDWTPRVGIIHRKDEEGNFTQVFLQCIALNNVCIYPYHGWLSDGEELQFHFPTTTFVGKMKRSEEFGNNDIAYTPLPKRIKGVSGGVILSKPSEKENVFHFSRIVSQKVKTEVQYQGFSITAHIDGNCWAHTVPTQVGSCGGPMLNMRGHLIGYHVGTAGDFSYNDFLGFSEELIKSIRKIDVSRTARRQGMMEWRETEFYKTSNYMPPMLNRQDPIPEEWQAPAHKDIKRCTDADWMARELLKGPSFELLGKMTRMVDYNTKISKNQDFAIWFNLEETKRHLDEINERRALRNLEPLHISHTISAQNREAAILDTSKYNRITKYTWSDDLLHKATQMVINLLEPHIQKCARQPLELVYQDMEWSTACGARYDGLKADFRTRVVGETNMMAYGEYAWARFDVPAKEYVPTIWTNSLKDELRPIEKVEANKTRTFTAAPIDFVVGAKQAVDQFNHQFMAKHLTLPHTVGINQWSGGWHRLYQKLEGKNFLYSSGDGSRFDSSPTSEMFDAIYTIRCHFADKSMWQVLNNIYTEICFTPIVLHDGNIVKKDHGNNSGQCSTVIDNSLIMLILCCAAYLEHTPPSWHSVKQMNEHWHFCVNGDDYIGGMSPQLAKLLTKERMALTFDAFQFKYEWSDYSKSLFDQEYMSLKFIKINSDDTFPTSKALIAPWREGSRQLSTLSHTTSFEPWIKLQVALTERVKAWVDRDLFEFITSYAKWYLNHVGESCQRKEWQEVQALWWDEQHIFNHYFSRESARSQGSIELFRSMPEGEDIIWGPRESFNFEVEDGSEVRTSLGNADSSLENDAHKRKRNDDRTLSVCFQQNCPCPSEHAFQRRDFNQKNLLRFCTTEWIEKLESYDFYELPESLYEQQEILFHVWFHILKGQTVQQIQNDLSLTRSRKMCSVAHWFSRQIIGVCICHYQNDNGKMNYKGVITILGKSSKLNTNNRQAMTTVVATPQHYFRLTNPQGFGNDAQAANAAWNALSEADKEAWRQRFEALPVHNGQRRISDQEIVPPRQRREERREEQHEQQRPPPQGGARIAHGENAKRQQSLMQKYGNILTTAEPEGFKQDVMSSKAVGLVENRWARRCGLPNGASLVNHPEFWRFIFTYVCNNGTSTSGNLEQEFMVNEEIIKISMLVDDANQHGGWRRFWRSKADDLYNFLAILKENGENMPIDWAKKNGFPPEHSHLGFDVVDYCKDLSPQEKQVLAAIKARAVPRNRGTLVGTSLKPNTGGDEETYGNVDRDIVRDMGGGFR